MKQHNKLLLGFAIGLILGTLCYYTLPQKDYPFMKWVVDIAVFSGAFFLRLIFMVVLPMLICALILGVYDLGKARGLGKAASRALGFTMLLTSIAIAMSMTLVNVLKPGVGLSFDRSLLTGQSIITLKSAAASVADKAWYQYLVDLLPQNPFDSLTKAFSGTEMIAVMFFALVFGYALSLCVKEDHPIIKVFDAIFQTSMTVIGFAMKIAPYGIAGIVFNTAYKFGYSFITNVFLFSIIVIFALAFQQFVVYALALKLFAKTNPWEFFKGCKEVYLYAFSTASSNATLPVALRVADETLKMPTKISRFILTIGATANQNGAAIFEGIAVLFLAQVFGVQMTLQGQFVVILLVLLAGMGTAGVPGGGSAMVIIIMTSIGVPAEGIGLILGVDRILDMFRTTLNVSGDLVIAKLVSAGISKEELEHTPAVEA